MTCLRRGLVRSHRPLVFVCMLVPTGPAGACMIVLPPGASDQVAIAQEDAIIVWDAASKTQHFIRRASFDARADDFGFLVPTPTEPKLVEAEGDSFTRLAAAVKPEIITKHDYEYTWTLIGWATVPLPSIFEMVDAPVPAPRSVEVLQEMQIAGYDATVLRAEDSRALLDWLNQHGYDFQPAMTEWLQPYVDAGWIVTAFKYSKATGAKGAALGTKAVRMSFTADRPFFPYREPPEQGKQAYPGRLLRVFLLSAERMEGTIGDESPAWPGRLEYARQRDDTHELLAGALDEGQIPASLWLTAFVDHSGVRPGNEDLFFRASGETEPFIPPPIIQHAGTRRIPLCLDVVVVAWALLAASVVTRRRRRANSQSEAA